MSEETFTCSIESTDGHRILVDFNDLAVASKRDWRTARRGKSDIFYAIRSTRVAERAAGAPLCQFLHRLIMNPPPGLVVDHKNRDGLDNRRANLRACSKSQNKRNSIVRRDSTTGFKGVYFDKKRRKYNAYIRNGVLVHLGYFADPIHAAIAYNRAALEIFGEFARPNEIPDVWPPEKFVA